MFQKLIDKSMSKSPWIFHINAGSCNGCDIELVSVLTPRYDAERLGFRLTGTPRQADIVVVSGPITLQTRKEWKIPALEVIMRVMYLAAVITGGALMKLHGVAALGVVHKIAAVAFVVLLLVLYIPKCKE